MIHCAHYKLIALSALLALPACAGVIATAPPSSYPAERRMFYDAAQRVIGLPDGSQVVIYQPDLPNGRPPAMRVFIVAPGNDRDRDRSFRLETFIADEIAGDYPGQIRSAAMSPDHQRLAFIGGWFSAHDKHGHNGVFVLRWKDSGKTWVLQSWFDVPDLALGDIAFGPDDLLLVTSRPHAETSAPSGIIVFTMAGQKMGSFIETPAKVLETRLARLSDDAYALYDSQAERVRFLRLKNTSVVEERTVPIPFPTERVNLVAFDPRPDGRIVFGRTIVVDHKSKTYVTVVDNAGTVIEEWQPTTAWRLGYADQEHVLHGIETTSRPGPTVAAVKVR